MSLASRLRRMERAMGAHREGRSLWVWLIPLGTAVFTFAMAAFLVEPEQLPLAARLPAAIVGALFMGGMSASYLAAGDDDEPEEREAERPAAAAPPLPPYVGRIRERRPVEPERDAVAGGRPRG